MSNSESLYRDEMKDHYRSEEIASEYDEAFSQESFRHQLLADRERKTVLKLLRQIPNANVLDIPAGTGKLAPVFKQTESSVVACDISPQMLRLARERYLRLSYTSVDFVVFDAERISCLDIPFDVSVCLRLLHRVPDETKRIILSELAEVSDYTIASFGITSTYHRYRRRIRKRLLGGDDRLDWYLTETDTKNLLQEQFELIDEAWVLPWLSQEKLYLLSPRD